MKKEFDLEKFKEENIAVHCKTQEELDDFVKKCNSSNMGFWGIDSDCINYFMDYKDMTCISCRYRLSYGNWDFYKKEGYTILEWSDYMEKEYSMVDLKPCYVVKRADGELRIIGEIKKGIVLINDNNFCDLMENYNDNLTYKGADEFDIIEVYGFSSNFNFPFTISTDNRKLLWKRSEMKKEEIITNNFELEIQKLQKRLDSLERLVSQW